MNSINISDQDIHQVEIMKNWIVLVNCSISDSTSDIDQNVLTVNSLPIYGIGKWSNHLSKFLLVNNIWVEKHKKEKPTKKTIFLSSSVGVGLPQRVLKPSHKIEIVHDLEENYRPRYKSDYFAQNGVKRKPRYVTDRHGSHYVTLKVTSITFLTLHFKWKIS